MAKKEGFDYSYDNSTDKVYLILQLFQIIESKDVVSVANFERNSDHHCSISE